MKKLHESLITLDCGGADLRRLGSPLSYSPMSSDGIMYFDGNDFVRLGPNGGLSSNPGIFEVVSWKIVDLYEIVYT